MLHVKNVYKTFHSKAVLKDLSFTLQREDFVVIMGPNGTGKSTLFDILSGKTAPDKGSILIDGIDITLLREETRAPFIGRLFQNTYLGSCSSLTIRENLAMATLKSRKACFNLGIHAFPKHVIEEFLIPLNLNLENLLDVPMGALSGGQRQIISFIMTILNPPKLLLLDEPTAALDPNSATQLLNFAKNYATTHNIPTLLITHDPLIAKHLGNRLWILEEGVIRREFGLEKISLNPQSFFHSIDYARLG